MIQLKDEFKAVATIGIPLNGVTPYEVSGLGGEALGAGISSEATFDNIHKPGGGNGFG